MNDKDSFNCFKCGGKLVDCKNCRQVKMQRYPFSFIPKSISESVCKQNMSCTIVGGGIAGLAVSIVLIQFGFNITLIEKDNSFMARKQGYGLTMQQGNSSLRELGIILDKSTISTSHYVFNEDGLILGYFGSIFNKYYIDIRNGLEIQETRDKTTSGKFAGKGRFNVHIPRQKLRKFLYQKLLDIRTEAQGSIDILWDTSAISIQEEEDCVSCLAQTGENREKKFRSDFLIGADGIYSTVRKFLPGCTELVYLKCVVILGISDLHNDFLNERVFESNNGNTRLYVMPFDYSSEAKTTMWQLSFRVESFAEAKNISSSPESLLFCAKERCRYFHTPISEMLQRTKTSNVSGHPVYDRSLPSPDFSNRIVVMGDALHPMSPFKGQGANQALLDASLLGKVLLKYFPDGIPLCVSKFHSQAIKRVESKVFGSNRAVEELHSSYAILPCLVESASQKKKVPLSTFLFENGIDASTSDLDIKIGNLLGPGGKPHVLHQRKIEASRASVQDN